MGLTKAEIEALPYRPCVGIMLINADGNVFAGRRLDSSAEAWQMPQGGIDPGEEPRAAAYRELGEETGIPADAAEIIAVSEAWIPYELPHDLIPKLWKGRYRGQEQKWFLMRFNGADEMINIQTEEPEFAAWKWMAPADLVGSIVPFKQKTYAAVLDEFQNHLG